jgi:hypothetical protein
MFDARLRLERKESEGNSVCTWKMFNKIGNGHAG